MHVNKFKCYKWILQSSVLVILTSWIQKCLWIWRIVLGGMISSPSFTYSLVSFSPATPSMHSASKPDFPEKDKLLLLLFFLFLSLCLLLVFIILLWGNSFCPGIEVISDFLNILCTFYVLKRRILLFHRSNKSQAFKNDTMEASAPQAQLQMRL